MKDTRKYGVYLLLLLIPALRLIFSSSHVDWLIGLELAYITALFLMYERRMALAIALIVVSQSLVEIFNYQTVIGIGALAFFGSVLAWNFLFKLSTIFAADKKYSRGLAILFVAIVFEQIFSSLTGEHSNFLNLSSLFANLIVFLLAAALYSKLKGPSNALKS